MGLPPDSASMIMMELGRELQFYEDTLALIGLLYIGKVTVSFSFSLYRGFKEHILSKLYPNKELVSTYGSWAIVSGATGGVGKAFAEELARRGLSIVLLDSDPVKLNDVAAELEQDTGVDTRIVEIDFLEDFIPDETYEQLTNVLRTIDPGILINAFQMVSANPTRFSSTSAKDVNSMLNANIKSLTMITYVVMNAMLQRKRGLILNISAFSGLYPIPFTSVYSASKAYIEFFSRCLAMECSNTNIIVQTVNPGFIKAEEDVGTESAASYLLPTMSTFVRNSVDSLGISSRITGSWLFSVQLWMLKRVPEIIMERLVFEIMSSAGR